MFRFIAFALLPLATASLAACDDHHHEDEEQFICDGTEDSLSSGTQIVGDMGLYKLEIVESIPLDHHYTGSADIDPNELIVQVLDANNEIVADASFDRIEPFTAKHDHGTPIAPTVEATANDGEFHIKELVYVHRGPWRVDMDLSGAGGSDFLQFVFCVEEHPSLLDAGGE